MASSGNRLSEELCNPIVRHHAEEPVRAEQIPFADGGRHLGDVHFGILATRQRA